MEGTVSGRLGAGPGGPFATTGPFRGRVATLLPGFMSVRGPGRMAQCLPTRDAQRRGCLLLCHVSRLSLGLALTPCSPAPRPLLPKCHRNNLSKCTSDPVTPLLRRLPWLPSALGMKPCSKPLPGPHPPRSCPLEPGGGLLALPPHRGWRLLSLHPGSAASALSRSAEWLKMQITDAPLGSCEVRNPAGRAYEATWRCPGLPVGREGASYCYPDVI